MSWQKERDTTPGSMFSLCSMSYLGAMLASNHALQHVSYPTQVNDLIEHKTIRICEELEMRIMCLSCKRGTVKGSTWLLLCSALKLSCTGLIPIAEPLRRATQQAL